jgi:hypothetical protein
LSGENEVPPPPLCKSCWTEPRPLRRNARHYHKSIPHHFKLDRGFARLHSPGLWNEDRRGMLRGHPLTCYIWKSRGALKQGCSAPSSRAVPLQARSALSARRRSSATRILNSNYSGENDPWTRRISNPILFRHGAWPAETDRTDQSDYEPQVLLGESGGPEGTGTRCG